MMREPVEEIGRCDTGCCVEIEREDGSTERKLLELGETVTSPKNSCHLYRCEVTGYVAISKSDVAIQIVAN